MQKAQISTLVFPAVLGLILFSIGLVIFQGVEEPLCEQYNSSCEAANFTNYTYTALAHPRIVYNSQAAYNWSNCTGAYMTNGTNYTMNLTDGGIRMIGAYYVNITGNKSIMYLYTDNNYIGSGTVCTIVDNMPVLFAVGGLILAGLWWMAR